MHEGLLTSLDAIEQATGEKEVNLLGFCIGGILTTATLAYMAATGDDRVKSTSLLATMIDLRDVGEVSVFVNEDQLQRIKDHVSKKGYLEGKHMADMFSMMRENDLIWSFVVNNYLMGKDPMPFDMLYWNSDSTRLPAEMLVYYLENFYLQNL
jgi:polyhydroxyalkanoate synthase